MQLMDTEFVNVEHFDTAENLLLRLDEYVGGSSGEISKPVFRGVGDEAFKLVPSALRPDGQALLFEILGSFKSWKAKLQTSSYFHQGMAEAHALAQFYQTAETSGADVSFVSERVHEVLTSNPLDVTESFWRETFGEDDNHEKWPQLEFLRVLGLAQHYGIPTRLLDWSFDPYVACFFGATSHLQRVEQGTDASAFAIWILSKHAISVQQRWLDPKHPIEFETEIVFVAPPYHGNTNLRAQRGCFTLLGYRAQQAELDSFSLGGDMLAAFNANQARYPEETEDETLSIVKSLSSQAFTKLVVSGSEAANLISALKKRGVSPASIFPGFDGVVKDVILNSKL